MRKLIKEGADVNYGQEGSWRPLHFAAEAGCGRIVSSLLIGGAIVDSPLDSCTGSVCPLHVAVSANNEEVVRVLLKNGANPFMGASVNGGAPIDYVTRDGQKVRDQLLRAMAIYKSKIDCYAHLVSDELPFEI